MEISKWVKKFQRISWEPEILISGGILFTLFQTQGALIQINNFLYPLAIKGLAPILGLFAIGISALTVGFSVHLISKAFWIAMFALKSVYPGGINVERLNYSESFLKKIPIDQSLDSTISKVGNTASLLFVTSFLFLIVFFGIGLFMVLMMLLYTYIPFELLPFYIPFELIIFTLLILPFIDFITFGILKKGELRSKIYLPYYKLFSWITLSFLYRDILNTLVSNIPRSRILLFTLFFTLATILLGYRNVAGFTSNPMAFEAWNFFDLNNQSMGETKYENLREASDRITKGTIHSDVITESHIKLYLRYRTWWDVELGDLADDNQTLSDSEIFSIYIQIKIDDTIVDSVSWNYTRKAEINQYGLIGFIPIPNLEYGYHVVTVHINEDLYFTAPFWKE